MRSFECDLPFVRKRNKAMHDYYRVQPDENMQYSYINFAYGQVFFQGWQRLMTKNSIVRETMNFASFHSFEMATFGLCINTTLIILLL